MKLTKASLFALYAVLELASNPERQVTTSRIADKYGISTNHLAKIMRTLIQNGVVQAVRGSGGGCRFVGRVDRTTLLDIIQLFEKFGSEFDMPAYGNDTCFSIVDELQNIRKEIDGHASAVLNSITLATALKNFRQCPELGT